MNNKILTWEILTERGFQGQGICVLCKYATKETTHLLYDCSYAGLVWEITTKILNQVTLPRIEYTMDTEHQEMV